MVLAHTLQFRHPLSLRKARDLVKLLCCSSAGVDSPAERAKRDEPLPRKRDILRRDRAAV